MQRLSVQEATARLAALARTATDGGRRSLVGISGPPGAGKSTVAAALVTAVPEAALVPMDGYHLAHSTLQRLGRVARKGAPDTFDAGGYVAMLRRLREQRRDDPGESSVWAPEFRREIEDAVAGAIGIGPSCPVVLTEGNYLLLQEGPWRQVGDLLDLVWYVDVPERLRQDRLTARHMRFGRDPAEALGRTLGSDQANAKLIAATRHRADALVTLD